MTLLLCIHHIVFSGKAIPTLFSFSNGINIPIAFYSETYYVGERTGAIKPYLPACIIHGEKGSFLELVKLDTNLVVGRHGMFDNSPLTGVGNTTILGWDTNAFPVLKPSYSGLYRCRTDTGTSTESYQLVVSRPGKNMLQFISVHFLR